MPFYLSFQEFSEFSMDTLNSTIKGTIFHTARTGFGLHPGSGTTLEVVTSDNQVKISGFFAAVASLNIEILHDVDQADIEHHTSSYVSIVLQGDNYVTPYEVHDVLNGMGWKLAGYSTCRSSDPEEGMIVHELWTKSIRAKKNSLV